MNVCPRRMTAEFRLLHILVAVHLVSAWRQTTPFVAQDYRDMQVCSVRRAGAYSSSAFYMKIYHRKKETRQIYMESIWVCEFYLLILYG